MIIYVTGWPITSPLSHNSIHQLFQTNDECVYNVQLHSTPQHHQRECNILCDMPRIHRVGIIRFVRSSRFGLFFNHARLIQAFPQITRKYSCGDGICTLQKVLGVLSFGVETGCSRMEENFVSGLPIEKTFAPINQSARCARIYANTHVKKEKSTTITSTKCVARVTRCHVHLVNDDNGISLSVHSANVKKRGSGSTIVVSTNEGSQLRVERRAGIIALDKSSSFCWTLSAGRRHVRLTLPSRAFQQGLILAVVVIFSHHDALNFDVVLNSDVAHHYVALVIND